EPPRPERRAARAALPLPAHAAPAGARHRPSRARGPSAWRPDLRALAGRPRRPGASAPGPDLRTRGLERHGHARLARAWHDLRAAAVLRAARGHAAAAARGLSPRALSWP